MAEKRKRSGCFWIGIGCGAVALILVVLFAIFSLFVFRVAGDLHESINDPTRREAEAMRILGADTLPDGYHAVMGLSVPLVGDVALLADLEPEETVGGLERVFDRRGFVYFKARRGGGRGKLDDYLNGKRDVGELFRASGVSFEIGETLGRGRIPVDDWATDWVASLGAFQSKGTRVEGIVTLISVDCAVGDTPRMGLWFAASPRKPPGEAADYTGTPADETAIADFMAHFAPCRN